MRLYNAIHTAITTHENQLRKLDNDLYVAHPLEVGLTLAKNNFSDDVIIAGLLHDTIEDTDMTLDKIESEFGPIVALYVNYCTESNKKDTWKNRKLDYLAKLSEAPIDVLFIVCVDKLTNIKSVFRNAQEMGDHIWDKFNAGYEDQKWYYNAILSLLSPISDNPLYSEINALVQSVFKE